ncbi:MAG: hybrid sensor histidine kinase/response regulator, partial [Xanthomonadales bacterium]|nr:hybrid sensor histidine kinase/response regulator [Xanthomonadales bacterium]
RELVEQLRSLHQPIARELGLTLTLDVANTVPVGVLLDEVRLTQVLGNLLTNALKFTRHGEVSLGIRAEVAAGPNFTRLHFCVEDTGAGMSADELKQLFKPFSKLRAGQLHRSGAGLGLSISHELVSLMGGELVAHSQPEVGTRFEFAITVEKVDPAAQSAHAAINSTDNR